MNKESDYELDKMERLYINECVTNTGLQHDIDLYKRSWEQGVTYAHKLELIIHECPKCNERLREQLAKEK